MLHPETSQRFQKAVLWAFSAYDENGQPTVVSPREITCRWEYVSKQIMGVEDTPISIDAEIWVDEDIAKGSMLWNGQLTALPSPATAVMEVVGFDKIPDVKGRVYERVVYARRYRESLPTVV